MTVRALAGIAVSLCVSTTAHAQYVLAFSDQYDSGVLLSAADGSIINANFIDIPTPRGYFGARKAIEVGSEIWVADILNDQIWKFDSITGAPKGSILGGPESGDGFLDGIRGLTQIGNTVYGTLSYSNAQYQAGIIAIDATTQQVIANYPIEPGTEYSLYDIIEHEGDLLVSRTIPRDHNDLSLIERYDTAGNFIGVFDQRWQTTDSLMYPTQMASTPEGEVLVAWAGQRYSGVYRYDADGSLLGVEAGYLWGPNGVALLPDGDIMWNRGSSSGDLYINDQLVQSIGITRMLSPLTVPSASTLPLLCIAGLSARRRR